MSRGYLHIPNDKVYSILNDNIVDMEREYPFYFCFQEDLYLVALPFCQQSFLPDISEQVKVPSALKANVLEVHFSQETSMREKMQIHLVVPVESKSLSAYYYRQAWSQ